MNVKDLRVQLEVTLSSVLGTYFLANGATTPAIAVRGWGESLPPGTKVTGVECVIIRDPEPEELRQYKEQVAFHRWTLFLVDWSGTASLQEVAGRVLWAWPGSNATPIQVPKGVGPRGQMRVDLLTNPDFDPQMMDDSSLLLENGSRLLLEPGDLLLLEA